MKNKAFSYKHIITYSILFIFFSYLYQTLLPFGDEPDFWIRARDYVKIFSAQPEWWVPFREFKPIKALNFLTSKLNHISDCHVGSSPLELFTHIDPNKCTQSDFQIILRVLINYLIILPLISFIFVCKLLKKKFADDFNNRVDVVLLTIIFPSYIYYQNLMSNEQLVYLLSITLFLSWKNRFITFILILLIISLDFGSALFPLCFYLFYHLVLICNKKEKKISNNIIFILTSFLLLSYILSYNLFGYILNLKILSIFPSLEKFILSIYSHHYYNGFIDKYPTFIRPLMAYFSFIFFTPGYLKSYLLIFLSIIFLLYFSFKLKNIYTSRDLEGNLKIDEKIFDLVILVFTILIFIFLLPAYSNFKYYIILIPFLLTVIKEVYDNFQITMTLVLANFYILTNLLVYRVVS